jgi:hypothetical protein
MSGTKAALRKRKMARRQLSQPWWLEPGTEICSVCSHLYLFETEYRCIDCDGPVCSACIETTSMVCLPCADHTETLIEIDLEI